MPTTFPISVGDSPSFQLFRLKVLESAMTSYIPSLLTSLHLLSHISSQSMGLNLLLVYLQNSSQIWPSFTNYTASNLVQTSIISYRDYCYQRHPYWFFCFYPSLPCSLFSQKQPKWFFLNVKSDHIIPLSDPILTFPFHWVKKNILKKDLSDCPYPQPILYDISPSYSSFRYTGLLIFPWACHVHSYLFTSCSLCLLSHLLSSLWLSHLLMRPTLTICYCFLILLTLFCFSFFITHTF